MRGGLVGKVDFTPEVLEECMTTTNDGIIKVSICGFRGELCAEVFTDAAEDDVLALVERDKTTIQEEMSIDSYEFQGHKE